MSQLIKLIVFLIFNQVVLSQNILYQRCFNKQFNRDGDCIKLEDCPSAIQVLRNNLLPITCGFASDFHPIVCCSNINIHDRFRLNQITDPTSIEVSNNKCFNKKTNQNGECVKISQCSSARELVQDDILPITCGFDETYQPIVCCTGNQNQVFGSVETFNRDANGASEVLVDNQPSLVGNKGVNGGRTEVVKGMDEGHKNTGLSVKELRGTLENIIERARLLLTTLQW